MTPPAMPPRMPACLKRHHSALAQLVEQMTVNHWVAGSSPAGGAKQIKPGRCDRAFLCPDGGQQELSWVTEEIELRSCEPANAQEI